MTKIHAHSSVVIGDPEGKSRQRFLQDIIIRAGSADLHIVFFFVYVVFRGPP